MKALVAFFFVAAAGILIPAAARGDDKTPAATPGGVLTFEKSFTGKLEMSDVHGGIDKLVTASEEVYELEFTTKALTKAAAGLNDRVVTIAGEVQRLPGIYKERHLVRVTGITAKR